MSEQALRFWHNNKSLPTTVLVVLFLALWVSVFFAMGAARSVPVTVNGTATDLDSRLITIPLVAVVMLVVVFRILWQLRTTTVAKDSLSNTLQITATRAPFAAKGHSEQLAQVEHVAVIRTKDHIYGGRIRVIPRIRFVWYVKRQDGSLQEIGVVGTLRNVRKLAAFLSAVGVKMVDHTDADYVHKSDYEAEQAGSSP